MTIYERYCMIRDSKGLKDSNVATMTQIGKSTFSDWKSGRSTPKQEKLSKIANALDVSLDYLTNGDELKEESKLTRRDTKEITEMLNSMEDLLKQDGLMFDGDPASPEAIDSILSAMKIGMEMAKQKNKEKYTPKKYKKE